MASQRRPVFPVGEARFLQIEVAFDSSTRLVGDAALTQQGVDELALGRDQLARQLGACRRAAVSASCAASCSLRAASATPSQRTISGSVRPSPISVTRMTPKVVN